MASDGLPSASAARPSCFVHEDDVPAVTVNDLPPTFDLKHAANPERYAFVRRSFTRPTGASSLGCSLMEVPPGKTAFPRHYHAMCEEAIYILNGEGEMLLGLGDTRYPVRKGDYVALRTGSEFAHQLWNTHETETLRYLCIAVETPAEVCHYPDSNKVLAWTSEGGKWFHADSQVPYFTGE